MEIENFGPAPKRRRSEDSSGEFAWKRSCFICTKPIDLRHPDREVVHRVETIEKKGYFAAMARKRNDKWGEEVLSRLENCFDLPAVEAVYHHLWTVKFKDEKQSIYTRLQ